MARHEESYNASDYLLSPSEPPSKTKNKKLMEQKKKVMKLEKQRVKYPEQGQFPIERLDKTLTGKNIKRFEAKTATAHLSTFYVQPKRKHHTTSSSSSSSSDDSD